MYCRLALHSALVIRPDIVTLIVRVTLAKSRLFTTPQFAFPLFRCGILFNIRLEVWNAINVVYLIVYYVNIAIFRHVILQELMWKTRRNAYQHQQEKSMNPEIKKEWVDALRSGEYKQGSACLKNSHNEFCCLGVLCNLFAKHFNTEWKGNRLLGKVNYLPQQVVDRAGVNNGDPYTTEGVSLSLLNDKNMPFKEIADEIEQNL